MTEQHQRIVDSPRPGDLIVGHGVLKVLVSKVTFGIGGIEKVYFRVALIENHFVNNHESGRSHQGWKEFVVGSHGDIGQVIEEGKLCC